MLAKLNNSRATSLFGKLLIIFLFSILLSRVLGPIAGSTFLLLVLIFLTGPLFPNESKSLRWAFAAVLVVGLSPLYLVIRGLISKTELNYFDFQIYASAFFATVFFLAIGVSKFSCMASYSNRLKKSFEAIPSLAGLFLTISVVVALKQKSIGDAVAWISSGDSKNHLVNAASITQYGFLDPATFLTQPVSSPTFLSLILSQGGVDLTSDTSLLGFQMLAYAHVWAILIGILGLTFAATADVIWRQYSTKSDKTPAILLAGASVIPLFSFILGPALFDGFFTAIFGISSLVVCTLWFISGKQSETSTAVYLFIGFSLFLSSLMSWMFIAVFTFPVLIAGFREILQHRKLNKKLIDLGLLILTALIALSIHFSSLGQDLIHQTKVALTADGAVSASKPSLYIFAIIVLLLIGLSHQNTSKTFSHRLVLVSIIHLASLIALKKFSNLTLFSWNYYLIKYQWIMVSGLFAILTAYAIVKTYLVMSENSNRKTLATFLAIFSIYVFSESVVPTNQIWPKIYRGWENPRSAIMNIALEQNLDYKNPTMFFHFGYAGDAMLGNFWMNSFAEPLDPIKGWNYTIDTTGDPQQLCDVNAYYPEVTVLTQDIKLESQLKKLCKDEDFTVKLLSPIN